MKEIRFYTTAAGRCPVQEHLDDLPDKTVQKVVWVLRVVRDLDLGSCACQLFAEERKADYLRRRQSHG